MKTYKQMAERVLWRRDEYDERKAERKAKRPVVSAAVAAAVMAVVILFGTVMGGVLKAPVSAPGAEAPIDDNPVLINNETSDLAETKETSPDYIVIKNANNNNTVNNGKTLYGCCISAFDDLNIKSISSTDMVGREHGDVCEVGIEIRPVSKNDKYFQKWVAFILPDDRIEIISPEISYFYYSIEENNGISTQIINISYKYKDGETNGTMDVYVFPESSVEFFEETYKNKLFTKNPANDEVVQYSNKNTIFFASVKGYDYWGYSWDHIYGNVAKRYGDVDENGIPLYEYDPYMADYCENPICRSKIQYTEELKKEAEREAAERDKTTEQEPDTVNDTQPGQQAEDGYPVPIEFIPDPDTPIFIDVKNDPDIYGTECKDVIRYQMRYNTRRDFGRECGNRVRLLIVASSSIQLLSPDVMTLDISENDSVDFELVFRYVEGNSRGTFRVFSVEDLYWDIDNNYKSVAELPDLMKEKDFQMIFTERDYGAVRTKGYDFFSGIWVTTTIYKYIAKYFGEVDDEGNPLFLSDPYMPDYYDCETCQRLRHQIEEREKFNREHSVITD